MAAGGSDDSWQVPTSDEEDGVGANDPLAPDPPAHIRDGQGNMWWQHEIASRKNNAELTPMEKHQLLEVDLPGHLKQDMRKVVSLYGKASGAGAAWKRVAGHMVRNSQPYTLQVDQPVQVQDPFFPLLKHHLISSRASMEARQESREIVGCNCIPATSFMPLGCQHKQVKILDTGVQSHLLCDQCSKCLRCGQLLA